MGIADCGLRIAEWRELFARESRVVGRGRYSPQSAVRSPQSKGFTLLELMIVISIIIILAMMVLPAYQRTVQQAKESVLRDDLFQLRKMLDQYAADKGQLPQSLDDLVSAGYVREIPVDPMTDRAEWNPTFGPDPTSAEGGQGVTDVHSLSTDLGSDGRPYSEW